MNAFFIIFKFIIYLNTKVQMNQDIFHFTKNYTFSENDRKAEVKIQEMIKEARSHMPDEFYTGIYFINI